VLVAAAPATRARVLELTRGADGRLEFKPSTAPHVAPLRSQRRVRAGGQRPRNPNRIAGNRRHGEPAVAKVRRDFGARR
jgi:hypothetical protein